MQATEQMIGVAGSSRLPSCASVFRETFVYKVSSLTLRFLHTPVSAIAKENTCIFMQFREVLGGLYVFLI